MVDWLMTAILEIFQFRTTKKHCAAQCRVRLVCAAVHPPFAGKPGISGRLRLGNRCKNGGLTLEEQEAIYGWQTQRRTMYAAPEIVGTCLTCITPSSFGATLALIAIGVLFAAHTERRKLAAVKARPVAARLK
jgi:hypothetical protein